MPPSSLQQLGVPVLELGDVGVERVHPDAERHVLLELRRGPQQRQVAVLLRPRLKLGEQAGFPYPRLALHGHAGANSLAESGQRAVEPLQLRLTPDGLCRAEGHRNEPTSPLNLASGRG